MPSPSLTVLGLSGSLRRDSYNTKLLRAAAQLLPPDTELILFERLAGVPPFSEDSESDPPAVIAELKSAVEQADAVLIASPEYNGSMPGHLKNTLDWVSRPYATNPLRNKPVAVVGASTGMFGAVWAQADARRILSAIGARVLEHDLPVAEAQDAFDPAGRLRDAELERVYGDLLQGLIAESGDSCEAMAAVACR
jgi:chromate reductase